MLLQDTQALYRKNLSATDGPIGHVKDFYFDDVLWVIRYVIVDTGSWLSGRLVLLSPHAFGKLDQTKDALPVNLSKKQIQDSPLISAHETVSRQFEEDYYRSYGWPPYWQGGKMWGYSGTPLVSHPLPGDVAVRKALEPSEDRHLQGTQAVTGYKVQAVDGPIGHVTGFQVDPESWTLHDLAVETGHWHLGASILVSPAVVERVGFVEKTVFLKVTKAQVRGG
jgi:hypothetical protein